MESKMEIPDSVPTLVHQTRICYLNFTVVLEPKTNKKNSSCQVIETKTLRNQSETVLFRKCCTFVFFSRSLGMQGCRVMRHNITNNTAHIVVLRSRCLIQLSEMVTMCCQSDRLDGIILLLRHQDSSRELSVENTPKRPSDISLAQTWSEQSSSYSTSPYMFVLGP